MAWVKRTGKQAGRHANRDTITIDTLNSLCVVVVIAFPFQSMLVNLHSSHFTFTPFRSLRFDLKSHHTTMFHLKHHRRWTKLATRVWFLIPFILFNFFFFSLLLLLRPRRHRSFIFDRSLSASKCVGTLFCVYLSVSISLCPPCALLSALLSFTLLVLFLLLSQAHSLAVLIDSLKVFIHDT